METETQTLIDMKVELSFLIPTSDIGEAEDRAAHVMNMLMNGAAQIPDEVDYTVEPTGSLVNPREPEVQQVNAWKLNDVVYVVVDCFQGIFNNCQVFSKLKDAEAAYQEISGVKWGEHFENDKIDVTMFETPVKGGA